MNRDDFFPSNDSKPKITDIPLPDGRIAKARKLSQSEVEHMSKKYGGDDQGKAAEGLRYVMVRTVVDDEGKRVFKDDDINKLGDIDFEIVKTIATEVSRFSGLNVPN